MPSIQETSGSLRLGVGSFTLLEAAELEGAWALRLILQGNFPKLRALINIDPKIVVPLL